MATERASLVRVSREGRVTLPKEVREALAEDGVIELRPKDVDPDQAWFWSERWQQMEREADEDYAAGWYRTFDTAEEFLADLERISAETSPSSGEK